MTFDAHLSACLDAIGALSSETAARVRLLDASAWDGPTNCPPWRVRDLVVHLVSSGDGFVDAITQGLRGIQAPTPRTEERAARRAALESASPTDAAAALETVAAQFRALYDGLSDAQLEMICWHRRGNRSVRWYAAHRLSELAFHSWDLRQSLGETPLFRDDLAMLLLPMLLESNLPRTYAAGLSAERGSGERFLLQVVDAPQAAWLVALEPDQLVTTRQREPADVTITGQAGALALLVYGRQSLRGTDFSVHGDSAVAARFERIFPRP